MWRVALLCSVVTLTVACGDVPAAPSVNTDGLSLQFEGDPPPPPLDGSGRASFAPSGSEESIEATESVTQQDCVLPVFLSLVVVGDYFRNPTDNNARIRFTPVSGSGMGIIHETANPTTAPLEDRQDASGTIIAVATNTGERHRIHLVDYDGSTLFFPTRSFGGIFGSLEAVVMACGEKTAYDGFIDFEWGVPPPDEEGAF
jgi:hypothetical protein